MKRLLDLRVAFFSGFWMTFGALPGRMCWTRRCGIRGATTCCGKGNIVRGFETKVTTDETQIRLQRGQSQERHGGHKPRMNANKRK
jgi:hypothetical protein